jgi:hypothetical protein
MPAERTLGWVQDAYDLQKIILVPSVIDQDERVPYSELAQRVHTRLRVGAGHRWPWAVEGFIRAAHSLQLLNYFRDDDTCSLTTRASSILSSVRRRRTTLVGEELPEPEPRSIDAFREAMLMNPQVIQLLMLLDQYPEGLTKYEIGERYGFVGEPGFSHITQELRVRSGDPNAEGSTDKYARTYFRWLEQMGWAESRHKQITIDGETRSYQAYFITYAGRQAKRRAEGLPKYVVYESLASRKNPFWDRERRIRAAIIDILSSNNPIQLEDIRRRLGERLNENFSKQAIRLEIDGLRNSGLRISKARSTYILHDRVTLHIPYLPPIGPAISQVRPTEQIQWEPQHLSIDLLETLNIAFDSSSWREFEDRVLVILEQLGYSCQSLGYHAPTQENPDIISHYLDPRGIFDRYALIVDTKAYRRQYTIPTNARRAMVAYINQNAANIVRNLVPNVKFSFVSGKFGGNIPEKLLKIQSETRIMGSCITAETLLFALERRRNSPTSVNPMTLGSLFSSNREITKADIDNLCSD